MREFVSKLIGKCLDFAAVFFVDQEYGKLAARKSTFGSSITPASAMTIAPTRRGDPLDRIDAALEGRPNVSVDI